MIWTAVTALVVFYAVFFIFPIGYALTGSFFNWMPTKRVFSYIGLENYRKIFEQSTLGLAMRNTLVFTVAVTLGRTLLGLLSAALIYGAVKLVDYAAGAKAAREALEGMAKTAKSWKETEADTFYGRSQGLSFFGMSKDDFTRAVVIPKNG